MISGIMGTATTFSATLSLSSAWPFPDFLPWDSGRSARATLSTYAISNPTLQLWLREGDDLVSLQRQDLECLPWMTIERAYLPVAGGVLEVEARHVFEDERTMRSHFVFTNHTASPIPLQPQWQGMICEDRELYMVPYFIGTETVPRIPFLEKTPGGIVVGLRVSSPGHDLPQVGLRIRNCGSDLTAETEGLRYDFHTALSLAPSASAEFQFLLEIDFITPGHPEFAWTSAVPVAGDFKILSDRARHRFVGNIGKPIENLFPALALKSLAGALRLASRRHARAHGEFGDDLACLCTSDNTDFSCTFFWDTLFSSVAISDFHQPYARGAIRTAFVRFDERDGSSPERKYNYGPAGRMAQQSPQSPVASWAVRCYLEKHDDPAFLAEIYPKLTRNHDFWETFCDTDRDGLSEFRWSGQSCDNSPLWDPSRHSTPPPAAGWLPPVASVALNSFLFWDANHLAALADGRARRGRRAFPAACRAVATRPLRRLLPAR